MFGPCAVAVLSFTELGTSRQVCGGGGGGGCFMFARAPVNPVVVEDDDFETSFTQSIHW